jgi:hypothetical protein
MSDWERSLSYFLTYLPASLKHWIVVYEGSFNREIVSRLKSRLKSAEFYDLEQEAGTYIHSVGSSYQKDEGAGFLEFVIRYPASVYDGSSPGAEGLDIFALWPQDRIKLCFDVTDNNFPHLFREQPAELAERCRRLRDRVAQYNGLVYGHGNGESLRIACADSEWVLYTGFEHNSDYVLPSGEVACVPRSVDGRLPVEGWLIGTIPFGVKYGRIGKGELELQVEDRKITNITGSNTKLCGDLEGAMSAAPRLQRVSEAGIGQSLAVRDVAANHKLGYSWHERHFGLHIGLGAELPVEDQSNISKVGGHHLDLVLCTGRLAGDDGAEILRW